MSLIDNLGGAVRVILDLGGPVVAVLIVTSILTVALIFYKLWQFQASGVGRHKRLAQAVSAWDAGDHATALVRVRDSTSYLAPVVEQAFAASGAAAAGSASDRVDAEAEARFARLERGMSALDMVAQLAPLVGLFGTVLGMIEAFQKLQTAGNSVDPSLLAGGIWVALLTTAAGLAVAMPTSMVLSWLEARMKNERVFANRALRIAFAPGLGADDAQTAPVGAVPVHGA